jgi:aerobic carbon-monoxide dehydrogenase small subunit
MSKQNIQIYVNGRERRLEVPSNLLLADCLRDHLHLTGTKRGCETGVCGACSVLVNGAVVKACLSLAVQANHAQITTVEGLAKGEALHPLQQSFMQCGGLQCGYCTPGFLMAAKALLDVNTNPSEAEVRQALNGNLCRCTGYSQIVESVLDAAKQMRGN